MLAAAREAPYALALADRNDLDRASARASLGLRGGSGKYSALVNGVTEPELTSDPPLGLRPTFTSLYTYGRRTHRIDYEVTALEAPQRYAVKSTAGPHPFDGEVILAPTPDGTSLANTINAGSESKITSVMFVAMGPPLRRMMRRQLAKELRALNSRLEAGSAQD